MTLIQYNQEYQKKPYLTEDTWHPILEYLLQTPKDFGNASRISKFFQAHTLGCIVDEKLALNTMERTSSKKLEKLNIQFRRNVDFFSQYLSKVAIKWESLFYLAHKSNFDFSTIIAPKIASGLIFEFDKKLPVWIKQSHNYHQIAKDTYQRIKRLENNTYTSKDLTQATLVEIQNLVNIEKAIENDKISKDNPNHWLILEAIKIDCIYFTYATKKLQNNPEFALKAAKENGDVLLHMNNEFKNNKKIVLVAVKEDKDAIFYASKKMQQDPEILEEAGLSYVLNEKFKKLSMINEIQLPDFFHF